jgi:hypothetical protein
MKAVLQLSDREMRKYDNGDEDAWRLRRDIRDWCRQTIGYAPRIVDPVDGNGLSDQSAINFRSANHLMLFKLKWS